MDLNKITNLRAYYSNSKIGYKIEDKKEFSIVRNILLKFGLPTKNFDDNLKKLVIESDNYSSGTAYDPNRTLITNPENSNDFIHELFHMASNNKSTNSFGSIIYVDGNNIGNSLNEGITDLFTLYANNNYKQKYPIESFVALVLTDLYGNELLVNHFNGESKKIYDSFKEDKNAVSWLIMSLDEFTTANIKLQDSISMIGTKNIDFDEYNPDDLTESFIDSISLLLKLFLEKDKKLFDNYSEILINEFDKDYDAINFLKQVFDMSSYENYVGVLNYIYEEINEETLKK